MTEPHSSNDSIEIRVNGADRTVKSGTTVLQLIEALDFGGARVAVERNRDIVPRAAHGTTTLKSGDSLELVTLVGGG